MMCVRCVWELPHVTWWIEIAARLLAFWPASSRLWTLPGARLETCIRTAPPSVAAINAVFDGRSHAGVWCYARGIFRARKLPGTVISVGNLTVGGTGKTPMVLWIAERLAGEEKSTAILTRGYRGTTQGGAHGEPQSDEVALLRERLSGKVQIGVGADRYKNGQVLAQHGTEWFVLDDGFQHMPLARDADIVPIDATGPFGGRLTLAAGACGGGT